ncbi:MAG: CoA transferase [Chloroflexota bacterium]
MTNILEGYRVLDFGRFIAGPYCAALLGYLGAEVIRVERPGGSEDRYLAPISEQGEGSMFIQMNCHKKGLTLDIAKPEGRTIVKQLVATADVVVANLPPKTLKSLELDYEALKAIKSDVILAANTTFGSQGPYANHVGFDGVAQSMSGAVYMSGFPGQPIRAAVQYIDFFNGHLVCVGGDGCFARA